MSVRCWANGWREARPFTSAGREGVRVPATVGFARDCGNLYIVALSKHTEKTMHDRELS